MNDLQQEQNSTTLHDAHMMGFLATRPNGVYTKVKLTSYSNGLGELVYTKLNTNDLPKWSKGKRANDDTKTNDQEKEDSKTIRIDEYSLAEKEQDNKDRSLRRAKSTVRKKIIEGELEHLITLTYKENMTDDFRGWRDFSKFIRKMRACYPSMKYVAVMEKQKRGAVHFHIAVHGFFQVQTVRRLWLDVCVQGNVDIQRKKHDQSLIKLATYLSKYLSKQKEQLSRFSNLFRCSQNIKLNELHFFLPCDVWADSRVSRLFMMLHGKILTRWDSGNVGAFHTKFIASYQSVN